MGWVLRLVETGIGGSSRSADVMAIDCPGDLDDIAALGLIPPPLGPQQREGGHHAHQVRSSCGCGARRPKSTNFFPGSVNFKRRGRTPGVRGRAFG
jgi:hypothetical protein